ncbi:cyclase family protein [Paenarthrobacter sp. NPDC058040]|uniref:cyclase family protein n=1 Tax=unclassified Paenarthrobacter TaxID=2634190 RepID=UPI0036DA1098
MTNEVTNDEQLTSDEVRSLLYERKNWGRWGEHDQKGAINLITPAKRLEAASAVRTGETLSLSRPLNTNPAPNNARPAQHYTQYWYDGGEGPKGACCEGEPGGWAVDYYGVEYHGYATTHLDALCHVWDTEGMYNGRDPHEHVTTNGATFGGVEQWAGDLVTRGVILDIPGLRGVDYVTADQPVHAWELEAAARAQGVEVRPGDALCVNMGREKWDSERPDHKYGSPSDALPGMHASCLRYLRDKDISILGWDMLDAWPWKYDVAWSVHGAIWAYGIAVVDNMVLDQLAQACRKRNSYEFMLVLAPLVVEGGTGSPINPLAIL